MVFTEHLTYHKGSKLASGYCLLNLTQMENVWFKLKVLYNNLTWEVNYDSVTKKSEFNVSLLN